MNEKRVRPNLSSIATLSIVATMLLIALAGLSLTVGRLQTAGAAPGAQLDLSLELISGGLSLPTSIAHTPLSEDGRLFITQQGGQIRILDAESGLLPGPFLDISSKVRLYGESGLLGLAFDPNYAETGYFYVYYTDKISYNNNLSRFQVDSANPNLADPNSEVILLTIGEPKEGHNGGALAFGPEGYLYIGVGDGGLEPRDAPSPYPQDLSSMLGKILRIDVSQTAPTAPDCGSAHYTIPTNPLADGPGGACDEIWSYGLRNPWRISFDTLTGDLFIADVGEQDWEEINRQPFGSGGQNYGWPCYEGNTLYHPGSCASPPDHYAFPIFAYPHNTAANHCSVTGGYMYRGSAYPVMWGHYLLADFCSGHLWSLKQNDSGWLDEAYNALAQLPTTFGQDKQGELYLAELTTGNLYHIAENTALPELTITKSGPTESLPGAAISYDIVVRNEGNAPATNLVISDTLPLGAGYVNSSDGGMLANGVVSWQTAQLAGSSVITVSFTVTATETIINADYAVTADDGVYAKGETAVTTQILQPKLAIGKIGPATAEPGAPLTYTLSVQNSGTLTATNLLITDTLPISTTFVTASLGGSPVNQDVVWQVTSLSPGETISVSLTVQPVDPGDAPLAIGNIAFHVTADGGYSASGSHPVYTIINGKQVFLPLIEKRP